MSVIQFDSTLNKTSGTLISINAFFLV